MNRYTLTGWTGNISKWTYSKQSNIYDISIQEDENAN